MGSRTRLRSVDCVGKTRYETPTSRHPDRSPTGSDLVDCTPVHAVTQDKAEEAEMKLQAFRAVVKDDIATLESILDRIPRKVWERWQNKAGKDLMTLSEERGSKNAYSSLAKALGLVEELKRESFEERETVWIFKPGEVQPLRATVLEDTPEEADEVLIEYWEGTEGEARVDRCMVRKMET